MSGNKRGKDRTPRGYEDEGWEGEKEVGRKFRREGGAWEDERIAAIKERRYRGRELIKTRRS